ncbi:MAG: hypothetical protein ABR920_14295 [Terriglobales bacterium]
MGRVFRFAQPVVFCVGTLLMVTGTLCAQDALPIPGVGNPAVDPVVRRNIEDWAVQQRGLPDDWTHHYLVFSNPGTEQQAIESGKYEEWLKIVNDPRFTLQQIKRSGGAKALEDTGVSAASTARAEVFGAGAPDKEAGTVWRNPPRRRKVALKKDWAVAMGGVAASGTGTVATNNASGTSTVTVDGQTLTGSAPTTAGGSGVFTGAPGAGQGVTITYGANVLNLTTNATASSVVGTVLAAPTSTTAPTITITNSAGSSPNTLSLTTSATGATATGTFSGAGPSSGQTITIKNGANTLTLTAMNGTYGTGTVSVANANGAANGDTITVGSVVYTFEETTSAYSGEPFTGSQYYCQNTTTPCVWWGTTQTNTAQALEAAITNNPSACPTVAQGLYGTWQHTCYSYVTAPNPSVTATQAAGVVTVTNTTGNSLPFNWFSTQVAWTLVPNTGSIPGYTSGTNGCTSTTAGTFIVSSLPATVASNLANAINACNSSFPTVGVTAYSTGTVVTIASTTLGSPASTLTLGGNASNFVWSAVTTGSPGSNGCTSATTGTFASGSSNAAEASNIAAAINACNSSYPAVGVTASYTSGSTFTVSSVAAGPYLAVGASNNSGLFSWGTLTAGSAGTNTCPSSTTGTFATSNNTVTLATNLAAAINACPAAAGVTAKSTGAVVILTARIAGSTGDSALGSTIPGFSWIAPNMSGGTDGTTSGTTFAYWSGAALASPTQLAANIATAINQNTTLQAVVSATSNGATVTVTADTPGTAGNSYGTTKANFAGFAWGGATLSGGTAGAVVQPNMYPAKYSFSSTTASCSDFVVYPMGTAGATGAATIVAFSNLYTGGCSGTVPSVYWAYNTGGMATTSPVPSLDGTQVAFVQVSGTTASLVLLKWAAGGGTPTLPVTPTAATPATYRGCTAPCMVTLAFSGNHNDTYSAPYYDYSGDTVYVGDDSGNLHKFTGLFAGTPAEAGSPWPVNLGGSKLSLPVYDNVTGNVILGDFGGVLYSVTASSGTVNKTISVGDVIADAPLVDSSAGKLYAFVTTSTFSNPGANAVYELSTNFTSIAGASAQPVGTGGAGYYLYDGIFDNVYYSSATSTGNLYVVGNTGVTTGANLYKIPITNSVMGAPLAVASGLSFTGAGATPPWPSPLNEFCNNGLSACTTNGTQTTAGTDYIFFSVDRGAVGGCTNTAGHGCVLSYNVSNPAAVILSGSGLTVTTPAGNGCWPTGGIVIDNSVPTGTLAGASQTYFIGLGGNTAGGPTGTTQTSNNCAAGTAGTMSATQASQANP